MQLAFTNYARPRHILRICLTACNNARCAFTLRGCSCVYALTRSVIALNTSVPLERSSRTDKRANPYRRGKNEMQSLLYVRALSKTHCKESKRIENKKKKDPIGSLEVFKMVSGRTLVQMNTN